MSALDKADLIASLRDRIAAVEAGGDRAVSRHGQPPDSLGRPSVEADVEEEQACGAFTLERTKSKVERLCVRRDQNSILLRRRLVREGFPEPFVDQAIERAVAVGLIDDERWGRTVARTRLSQGKGVSGIRRELALGGVDLDSLSGWPDEFVEDDEALRARKALEKRPPRAKDMRGAAYRRLVSKGFSPSVASSVAREWSESVGFGVE